MLFAGDHGVAGSGVTAWPSEVTRLMVKNIRAGGAASTVLARQTRTDAVLIDVGVLGDVCADEGQSPAERPGIRFRWRRIRAGTRDLALEPALLLGEFEAAIHVGRDEAREAASDGMRVVAAGEMGIGNTTPSACLAMLLADVPLGEAVGRARGPMMPCSTASARSSNWPSARVRRQWAREPLAALAAVAGLEIAAMAGFYAEAHAAGLTIVLDGYVAGAAALIAELLTPGAARSMIASHLSAEPGHRFVLDRLRLRPFLHWNLRLGEGTGALLLMPLLDAAAAMTTQMARLQDLGISRKIEP